MLHSIDIDRQVDISRGLIGDSESFVADGARLHFTKASHNTVKSQTPIDSHK